MPAGRPVAPGGTLSAVLSLSAGDTNVAAKGRGTVKLYVSPDPSIDTVGTPDIELPADASACRSTTTIAPRPWP